MLSRDVKSAIKYVRSCYNLSQNQFSKWSRIPLTTIRSWEQGKREPPEYLIDMMEQNICMSFVPENSVHVKIRNTLWDIFGVESVFEYMYVPDVNTVFEFAIPEVNLFIDCMSSEFHGDHWFDENDKSDVRLLELCDSENSDYGRLVKDTWTKDDVAKREWARKNDVNYVTFWSKKLADIDAWFKYGCPMGKDWDYMYSWTSGILTHDIFAGVDFIKSMADIYSGYEDYEVTPSKWNVVFDKYVVDDTWIKGQMCYNMTADYDEGEELDERFEMVLLDPERRAFVLIDDVHTQFEFDFGRSVGFRS